MGLTLVYFVAFPTPRLMMEFDLLTFSFGQLPLALVTPPHPVRFPAHKSCEYFLSYPTKGIYQRQGYITKGKETTCGYLVFIASSTSSKALLGC